VSNSIIKREGKLPENLSHRASIQLHFGNHMSEERTSKCHHHVTSLIILFFERTTIEVSKTNTERKHFNKPTQNMFECPTHRFPSGYLPAWRVAIYFVSAFSNLFVSIAAFFFVGSIFSRKRVYKNTLNLYVAFLLLPDAWNNFVAAVYGFFEVAHCGFSQDWRVVYEFTIFFYFGCNFYLNVGKIIPS